MQNPASTEDLTNRGYTLTEGSPVAQTRLDEAWRALQAELPHLVTWIGRGYIGSATVADVVAAATLRVLRNPEGRVSESTKIDDFSESWKLSDATEDLYFTRAELRRLSPAQSATAGSISFGPAAYRCR